LKTSLKEEIQMNMRRLAMGSIAVVLLAATVCVAQDRTSPPDVPLRITVVFNEYDGSKKIASLPYEMPCKASVRHDPSALQMGFRVPYKVKQDEIQFMNVGTHIDCQSALPDERGHFLIQLAVEHNTVYAPAGPNKAVEWRPGEGLPEDPVFAGIQANLRDLLLHDGQTLEALTATDPVSGHLWKVEVTLNVAK
jgi:hypothetical protein